MPRNLDPTRRRREGLQRFRATSEEVRAGILAGRTLLAIWEAHKSQLAMSYSQFARYVKRFLAEECATVAAGVGPAPGREEPPHLDANDVAALRRLVAAHEQHYATAGGGAADARPAAALVPDPAARSLRELNDFLAAEHDEAIRAAEKARGERDRMAARAARLEEQLRDVGRRERPAGPVDPSLVRALAEKRLTVEGALRLVEQQHPGRLIILESAWRSARLSEGFRHAHRAFGLLQDLATHYLDALRSGKGDVEARRVFGGAYAAQDETGAANGRARELRTFLYNGRSVLMVQHLRIGVKPSPHETWRCHFAWDAQAQVVVVGHCGPHLDLR